MQCSKLVKNRKKTRFFYLFIYIFGQIWMAVSRGYFTHNSSHKENVASACRVTVQILLNAENVHHVTKLIINVTKVTLKSNCTMYHLYLFSFQTYHKNKLTASISFVSRMFPKVRSRWIMPCEWRYKTPLTTWVMMWRATKRRKVSPVTKIKIILNNNDKINIHLNRNHHWPRLPFEP